MGSANTKKQAIITQKDFNLIIRVLKANWWIPLIFLPIFYFIGTFYIYRLTSTYKISTQILLQNNDAYYKGNVVTDANFYGGQSYIDNSNEKRVLLSYDLLNKVVNKLKNKLEISYFIVGKVRTTEQFGGMPFNVMINNINSSLCETVFDFKIIDSTSYEIAYLKENKKEIKKGFFGKELIDLDFNMLISKNLPLEARKIELLKGIYYQFIVHSNEYLIYKIRENMSVENPDYTNILELSLNDIIPERAVLILDSLNQEYFYSKLKSKIDLNDKTIDYIDRQLNEISILLNASVDTLQMYKQRKSIINLTWEEGDFLGKIGSYDQERSLAQMQIQSLSDLEKYIIEDKDPQFLPPSIFIAGRDGFIPKAATELYTKQIELNRLYYMVTEANPGLQEHINTIKKLRQDLLVSINNERKATLTKIDNINSQIAKYIDEAKSIPQKQQDILGFQRKLDVNESIYNFLLEKKANTRIAKASIVPDATIIETPRNTGEVSPDRMGLKRNFLSAGFAISILIIFLRTLFFTKIKSIEHLKELSNIPAIGVIPFVKKTDEGDGAFVDMQPNSLAAEAFRNIRTNLQYASVGIDQKTFLVTSFLPGEGKTFTSINLATTLAKTGKKTLIMELDLHKPKVYKNLGLPAQLTGITTYISNQGAIDEIIKPSVIPNLYCMFAGPVPPNPSDFVLSEKLRELITYAKSNFDYVIIDSPPAGLLSDSVFLMQFADSTLFVLNANSSKKKAVNFVNEIKESNNIANLLFVLNGVRNIGKRYYYKGYGYSYGYGYGYGYGKGSSYSK